MPPRKTAKSALRPHEINVGGKSLRLTNLDKVFYPASGFTKGQVIDYYARIAPVLLPHLRDRPLTLKRYPEGVNGPFFYEKRCPPHRPRWVRTAPLYSHGRGHDVHYCLANDLPTLIWAANLADLELHTPLFLARDPGRPTLMVFDLDPGPPADILACCEVALLLERIFDGLGLESFPKTSGSKGLQVYVPLNTPARFAQTKALARALAEALERARPDRVVSSMKKERRRGKVLVDWSQNDEHKTTVCVYSLRARERPTVSTPVSWQEVQTAFRRGDPDRLVFDSDQVLARVARHGDLFAPVLTLRQRLPESPRALEAQAAHTFLGSPG